MKSFSRVCLLAAVFVIPNWAWAECVMTPNDANGVGTTDPFVYNIPSFDTGPFDPNVPNGTVIAKQTEVLAPTRVAGMVSCYPYIGSFLHRGTTAVVGVAPGGRETYSTGINGVGLRIKFAMGASSWSRGYWPVTQPYSGNPTGAVGVTQRYTLYLELVKIGPITAGGALTGEVAGVFAGPGNSWQTGSFRIGGSIVVQPQVPTCRVTTPTITVPLGSIAASTFNGVGTVSPSKPFNIVLQCSGGVTGTVTNVHTTLTDHTDPGNVSDTLSLARDSGATGIGIQVLNGSTVIKYGPDSSAAGNTNQWKAGEAGNGTFTIPLTARYVQTAPKITPGTADGLATFTMSYQ